MELPLTPGVATAQTELIRGTFAAIGEILQAANPSQTYLKNRCQQDLKTQLPLTKLVLALIVRQQFTLSASITPSKKYEKICRKVALAVYSFTFFSYFSF